MGAVGSASTRLEAVVEGADLVVICTPVGQMETLGSRLAGLLAPGAVVTDVGSVKAPVVAALEPAVQRARARFVGGHPLAGSEKMGVRAAREDLFQGAVVVLTPTASSDPETVDGLRHLWESVGSQVLVMSAERHDDLVSRSSHLPHLIAAALAHAILAPDRPPEQDQLCATGFRDTTRVASGSPEMWRDIALANRRAVLSALDAFDRSVAELRRALEAGNEAAVGAFLQVAKERRDAWQGGGARPTGE